ncbi:MAG: hypothetical protein U0441_24400 [Polyangiaceae bacterium]
MRLSKTTLGLLVAWIATGCGSLAKVEVDTTTTTGSGGASGSTTTTTTGNGGASGSTTTTGSTSVAGASTGDGGDGGTIMSCVSDSECPSPASTAADLCARRAGSASSAVASTRTVRAA